MSLRRIDRGGFGPMKFLKKLITRFPEIEDHVAHELAVEAINRAKKYIDGDLDAGWDDLWEESRSLYHWTPEFNKDSRSMSRSSDHPLKDTGHLRDSFYIENISTGVYDVGNSAEYAALHEFGDGNGGPHPNPLPGHAPIPARPFLTPALMDISDNTGFKSYFSRKLNQYVDRIMRESME